MRNPLKSTLSWSNAGWIVLLAFLALPNCTFDSSGLGPPPQNFVDGELPHSSAIFCDIDQVLTRHCATPDDLATGIRLRAGAVALNAGQTSTVGIDETPEARARCGGQPEAFTLHGPFPEGLSVCLNCGVVGADPAPYADPLAACVAKCTDIFGPNPPDVPAPSLVLDYCRTHTRVSTNFTPTEPEACLTGACTDAGMLLPDFTDPRRAQEPVQWADLIGVTAAGNTLTRTAPTSGDSDAGAASAQWIAQGDAFMEMEATATNVSHVGGLAEIPGGCAPPCTDATPGLTDITFAISLANDGNVYIIEGGTFVAGPGVGGSFGAYTAGERYRVNLRDNSDGTATVTYSRLTGSCMAGSPCPETVFYTHAGAPAHYPLRVDTSFFHAGSSLANVTLVRIR